MNYQAFLEAFKIKKEIYSFEGFKNMKKMVQTNLKCFLARSRAVTYPPNI